MKRCFKKSPRLHWTTVVRAETQYLDLFKRISLEVVEPPFKTKKIEGFLLDHENTLLLKNGGS